MYSEAINVFNKKSKEELSYILDNLCEDAVTELKLMFGDDYKNAVLEDILRTVSGGVKGYFIKLKETNMPVGTYGVIPQTLPNSAGIFFLTTNELHKGNVITLLKEAKKQIQKWSEQYSLLMDMCYKNNSTIIKWLRLLGFKASMFQNDNFQIYYKCDLSLFENEGYYDD